jgi:hypothetical protein
MPGLLKESRIVAIRARGFIRVLGHESILDLLVRDIRNHGKLLVIG